MHRVDDHDLAHAARLGLDVVAALPCPLDETGRINPQVTRFALRDGRFADVVHVKPVYYQHANGAWRPLSEVCSHHGNRQIAIRPDRVSWVHPAFLIWLMTRQRLLGSELAFWVPGYSGAQPADLAFAATLTAYPDPNPETTTVDGYVQSNKTTWALAHAATDGTGIFGAGDGSDDSSSTLLIQASDRDSVFVLYKISRGFVLFLTSALTTGATISSATMSLWGTAKTNTDNDGDDWFNIVQSSPASNTAIANGDFDQCGAVDNPTEGATRIDLGSISTGAYTDWTLDATGLTWISKTSVTKLGLREGHDCINSAVNAGSGTLNSLTCSSADNTGTSQDPKLVVTYTPPPAGLLGDPLRAFQHMITR